MSEQYIITDAEATELLREYVSNKCCASTKPIKRININRIEINNAYTYHIESFTEKRESVRKNVPYLGGVVDDIENGDTPPLWSIQIVNPKLFVDETRSYNMPHTEKVVLCDNCNGIGKVTCNWCDGIGGTRYTTTVRDSNGDNQTSTQWRDCSWCHGSGRRRCTNCLGIGKVKSYLELSVTFKTYTKDCVINDFIGKFPNKLVTKALSSKEQGPTAVYESAPKLTPLYDYPDLRVKQTSIDLLDYMNMEYETDCSTIIEQMHTLNVVNIATIIYEYDSEEGMFFIYGNNKVVYFPDYPGKCCCNYCTLL